MENEQQEPSESEWVIMDILWSGKGSMTSKEVIHKLGGGRKQHDTQNDSCTDEPSV